MISKLIIRDGDTSANIIVMDSDVSRIQPESIWKNIVQRIKEIKNGEWVDKWANNKLTFEHLIASLMHFHEYYPDNNELINDIEYFIYVDYYETIITLKAYLAGDKESGIVCYENRYVIDDKNEGNCIDDFIKRGIEPQIANINDLVNSIKDRLSERQIAIEYHNTGCYERDFTQISLIKKFAQKIVDNCDKHLERISEFYTKL